MYSGTTLTKASGRVLGAHQRIDRVARIHLERMLPNNKLFPLISKILQFEGKNGPDAIKRKSPAQDEPWHYYSPFDTNDSGILEIIDQHYKSLVSHLKSANKERAAFEAAWLAHALVDGLTPAHHYPYEAKLIELRGGQGIETRTTIMAKILMPGITTREKVKNNWKMWGPRGLISSHGLFEMGVATLMVPLRFGEARPKKSDIRQIQKIGLVEWFKRSAKEVAVLEMYDLYQKSGWTPRLAYKVRHQMGPTMVKTVTLAWYQALVDAGLVEAI